MRDDVEGCRPYGRRSRPTPRRGLAASIPALPAFPDQRLWAAHLPQEIADLRSELLRDASLPGRIARRWSERPPWPQLQDVDGTWIASDELEARTAAAATSLLGLGAGLGERVLLCGPSSARLIIAYLAALRAGLIVVPVNPAYTEREVTRIVADSRPAVAVVAAEPIATWVRRAAPGARILGLNTLAGGPPPAPGAGGGAGARTLDRAGAEDPALLVYTSGTTGRPKGALLTHGNLLASATAVNLAWRWRLEDRLALALPLFHVHGLGVGVNGSLCAGASLILRPRFDPDDLTRHCVEGGATLLFGVPTMYRRLLDEGLARRLAGLRLLVSGSAPLPALLAERIAAETGQMPLERYGMTETVMLTSNPHDGPRKPGSVGFQLPGVDLRLARDGEVQVRGPNVIAGYWDPGRPDCARVDDAFTADGWFRTGDIGELDGDGYLRLVGRSKELIISGGHNVHPREVEEALAEHPAVREVAVVGRPSQRWGEEVTAVVVAERPVEPAELLAHARRRLAPYKVPKRVEFTDALPRNALGKVVRGRL